MWLTSRNRENPQNWTPEPIDLKVLMNSQGPALNDDVSASSSSSVELGGLLSEAKIIGRSQMLSSDEVHTDTHTHLSIYY